MHTRASETSANGGPGVAGSVKQVTEHAKALVALELELAKLEIRSKLASLGAGIGLLVAAAILAVFALGFLLAAAAAGLAAVVDVWLAILLVGVVLAVAAGVLGGVGARRLKRGAPPVPEQAIREAKLTTSALKSDARDG